MATFTIFRYPEIYAVENLDPGAPVTLPVGRFVALLRREHELTRIRPVTTAVADGVVLDGTHDWHALAVAGPFDFTAVGVLARLVAPLAAAGIPILALSTWETDVLLVRSAGIEAAVQALELAGHRVLAVAYS